MHAGFEQFKAFDQDAIDNKAFVAKGKLAMPVLAVGGEKSFGPKMAEVMRFAATNVEQAVVPNSGHWVMEENPAATISLVTGFPREVTPEKGEQFHNPWPDSEPHGWRDVLRMLAQRRSVARAATPRRGAFPSTTPMIAYPRRG